MIKHDKKIIIILLLEYFFAFGQGISIGYDLLGKSLDLSMSNPPFGKGTDQTWLG
jgi:hypothetical protein